MTRRILVHDQINQRRATDAEIDRMISLGAIAPHNDEDGRWYSVGLHSFHVVAGVIHRGASVFHPSFEILPQAAAWGEIMIVPMREMEL